MLSSWQLLGQNVLKLKELISGMSGLRCLAGLSDTCSLLPYLVFKMLMSPGFWVSLGPLKVCHLRPWQQWSDLLPVACEHRGNSPGVRCKNLICLFFFPGSNWKPTEWHLSPSPAALLQPVGVSQSGTKRGPHLNSRRSYGLWLGAECYTMFRVMATWTWQPCLLLRLRLPHSQVHLWWELTSEWDVDWETSVL